MPLIKHKSQITMSAETSPIDIVLSQDIQIALSTTDVGAVFLEDVATRLSRKVNLVVRGAESTEISIPNACVKLFADEFTNEAGKSGKKGEVYELLELPTESSTPNLVDELDEVADVVGKYALGLERVANAQDERDWIGFARDFSEALGFSYETALLGFIAKYSERIANGKNKDAEHKAVAALLATHPQLTLPEEGFLEVRQQKITEIWKNYPIEQSLGNLTKDLSAWDDSQRYVELG